MHNVHAGGRACVVLGRRIAHSVRDATNIRKAELTFYSRPSTELLTVPMYAVACIFVVVTSILADRQKTRFRYMMLDLILCFFGLIINRE